MLELAYSMMWSQVPVGRAMQARDALQSLSASTGGSIAWVDACAGTSLASGVLDTVRQRCAKSWGIAFLFPHLAAIEIVKYKQNFILGTWAPLAMYGNVRDMINAQVHEVISDKPTPPPTDFEFMFAGIECDDYSAINMNYDGPGCYGEDRGKSGQSARGCIDFIKAKRPRVAVLENVKGSRLQTRSTRSTSPICG